MRVGGRKNAEDSPIVEIGLCTCQCRGCDASGRGEMAGAADSRLGAAAAGCRLAHGQSAVATDALASRADGSTAALAARHPARTARAVITPIRPGDAQRPVRAAPRSACRLDQRQPESHQQQPGCEKASHLRRIFSVRASEVRAHTFGNSLTYHPKLHVGLGIPMVQTLGPSPRSGEFVRLPPGHASPPSRESPEQHGKGHHHELRQRTDARPDLPAPAEAKHHRGFEDATDRTQAPTKRYHLRRLAGVSLPERRRPVPNRPPANMSDADRRL